MPVLGIIYFRSTVFSIESFLGGDYVESFQTGLSFNSLGWAEIVSRLQYMARSAPAELKLIQLRSSKDKISVRDETMKSRNALYFALFHRVKFVQVFTWLLQTGYSV